MQEELQHYPRLLKRFETLQEKSEMTQQEKLDYIFDKKIHEKSKYEVIYHISNNSTMKLPAHAIVVDFAWNDGCPHQYNILKYIKEEFLGEKTNGFVAWSMSDLEEFVSPTHIIVSKSEPNMEVPSLPYYFEIVSKESSNKVLRRGGVVHLN